MALSFQSDENQFYSASFENILKVYCSGVHTCMTINGLVPFCAIVQALEELSNSTSIQLKWIGAMFSCVFVPYGVPGQVWYLNVLIPDLCTHPYYICYT